MRTASTSGAVLKKPNTHRHSIANRATIAATARENMMRRIGSWLDCLRFLIISAKARRVSVDAVLMLTSYHKLL
ncbi:MAG: hypothetical protein DWH80_10205 [Planctomycetota bacterium]|nr:MAG: hypothetical protein DWH80_10205 [Planctomycetota bacterium]